MTTITTRSGKGSALTHTELDNNFTNLNTDKLEATDVANVAISGEYSDLANVPTIPTHTSNLTNDSGFITSTVTGNLSATGNVSAGNVTATAFYGDGSNLTGISTSSLSGNMVGNISGANTHSITNLHQLDMENTENEGKITFGSVQVRNYNNRFYVSTDTQVNGAITAEASGNSIIAKGAVQMWDDDASHYVGLQAAGTTTANVTYNLPAADGSSGQVLSTDGAGNLSWATGGGSLSGSLTGNIDTAGYNLSDSTGNVNINDDLVVSGNISTGSLKSLNIGSVKITNNNGAPASAVLYGGLGISGAADAASFTVTDGNLIIENSGGVNFYDSDNSHYVRFRAPGTLTDNFTHNLPNGYGSSGQFLQTDGGGNLTWASAGSGSLSGNLAGNIDTGTYYIQSAGAQVLMGNVWIQGSQGLAVDTISSPSGDFVTIEGVIAPAGIQVAGNIVNPSGANVTVNDNLAVAGNVYATAFVGDGSQLTGISGGSGSLSGNLAGDVYGNAYAITAATAWDSTGSTRPVPRVLLGNGPTGNTADWGNNTPDYGNSLRNSRVAFADRVSSPTSGQRYYGMTAASYYDLGGGSMNSSTRFRPFQIQSEISNGSITTGQDNTNLSTVFWHQLGQYGNITITGDYIAVNPLLQMSSANTTITGNAIGVFSRVDVNGSANRGIAFQARFGGTGATDREIAYYVAENGFNSGTNNSKRWFLRCEENSARSRLAAVDSAYEYYQTRTISSGALNNKIASGNGGTYYTELTENVTSIDFGSPSDWRTDLGSYTGTVTWLIKQDSTGGRTITWPTGSNYHYAGGAATINTAANSWTAVTITAISTDSGTSNQYLIAVAGTWSNL